MITPSTTNEVKIMNLHPLTYIHIAAWVGLFIYLFSR